jgi:adenosylmethionine-8-amino-7-oxononanoate aminotransferase
MTYLWHPFAQMGAVSSGEFVVDRGEDVWIWDAEGRRYFDATASLWYANVGHGRHEIREAVSRQMEKIEAYSIFGDFATAPALELAERLVRLAPVDDARVFLSSGGGDSIDTAFKLARRYWYEIGQPERTHVISREHGYHGSHGYGTSLAGIPANRHGSGPLIEDQSVVAYDSVEALEARLQEVGPERVAAFFVEPVIGAGGVYPPPEGYIEGVASACKRHGVLLVVDSVICAFGRLGNWFGPERWEVRPDMITFAKGVTSGYLPLGGLMVDGRVAEPFWGSTDAPPFRHGATYAGHAACCAAALANLDILENERLIPRGRELEGELLAALAALDDHPLSGGARGGVGLLAAVELDAGLLTSRPGAVSEAFALMRERGVLVRALPSSIAVSPPLTATPEHFALITEALAESLDVLAARARSAPAMSAG